MLLLDQKSEPRYCFVSQCEVSDLEPFLSKIREAALKHSLEYGVGFLHESMSQTEKDTIMHLFSSGAIQVR